MNEIRRHPEIWYKHFNLMADIDLGQYGRDGFNIIGRLPGAPFGGVFDGVWMICEGRDYPRLRWEQVQCGP